MPTLNLSGIVQELLGQGLTPRQVRLELAARGIKWGYQYTLHREGARRAHVGVRERRRNLRRIGLQLCEQCQHSFSVEITGELCPECLVTKWLTPNTRTEEPAAGSRVTLT